MGSQRSLLYLNWTACAGVLLLAGAAFSQEHLQKLHLPNVAAEGANRDTLPINLPTALKLANARPLDISMASQRIAVAAAQLEKARTLWLPTIFYGVDYFRHDGRIQDVGGRIFSTSRSSFMVGAGPSAVFAVSDALFAPLAAVQVRRGRDADWQTAVNDSVLAVAEAYFGVMQARGELAGNLEALKQADDLARRMEKLTPALAPNVELNRARTELARRRQAVELGRERWQVASAQLAQVLRLKSSALVDPLEDPDLRVTLVDPKMPVDDLVVLGLTNRPELASRQALVQATLARLKQERLRPLVPSILLRGNATNPAGTLSSGTFGGGNNSEVDKFAGRNSMDVQVLWELQNLGFGNRAAIKEKRAENELAALELFRTQDRVAAEVVQALSQASHSAQRAQFAEDELRNAQETIVKSLEGLGQTRRAGDIILLVVRPQEVVAALQALSNAYGSFYGAVADANRAQFRLYRALGNPGQSLTCEEPGPCLRATLGAPMYQDPP